jgi:aminopeptidase N
MPLNCCSTARNFDQVVNEENHNHHSATGTFTINEKQAASYAPDTQLEPYHIDIYAKFDTDSCSKKRFELRVIQHIVCNFEASTIVFNGFQFHNLAVRDLSNDVAIQWTYNGELIQVKYERDLKRGEKRQLEFTYIVDSPLSSIAWNDPTTTDLVPNVNLGKYAVTDHETERARFWLACIDYPVVRTSINFYFTIPSDWDAYANGKFGNETAGDNNTKTVEWNNTFPCPSYLICFAVGELLIAKDEDVTTDDGTTLPIGYIAPRGTNEEDLRLTFSKTRSIIKFLENKVGVPFPKFEKYYQVIAPRVGGAMENISLVSWDNLFLLDQNYAREWKVTTDIVVLHECAHSYFGDALVIRHFEHAWLKESFAKFFEKTWAGHEYGHTEMTYELYIQMTNYMQEADNDYVRPIVTNRYDSSWDMFDRHLYPGGAWRLHMLLNLLGEKVFWEGVKNYVQQYSTKIVETVDFQRSLEAVYGRNLTKFFEQWIYGCGYPKLDVDYKYDLNKKRVIITAKQTQIDDKKRIDYFDFELNVKVVFENEEKDGVLVFSEGKDAVVTLNDVPGEPQLIRFDPNQQVLFKINDTFNPGPKILLNTLRNSPDIFNRILAAKQFIKYHSSTSGPLSDDLIQAIKSEKFYGIRAQIAHALSANKTANTARVLTWMIENETEPLALLQVMKASSSFRDSAVKKSVLEFLKRSEKELLPYISHANALQALAAQRTDGPEEERQFVDLILKHIDEDKQFGYPVVKKLGYAGLASFSQSKYVYEELLKRVKSEKRQECLAPILSSLGSIAATLTDNEKRQCVKLLLEYTRSSEDDVKSAAIRGLVTLQDKSALPALEVSRTLFAAQYQPWVRKQINQLKEAKKESDDVSSLKKQVDTLEQTLRKLQQQLDDLQNAQK